MPPRDPAPPTTAVTPPIIMPDPSQPIAFLNGRFEAADSVRLPVSDLGLVAGAAVTEMIRTFDGQPFRMPEHLERLVTSLDTMHFPEVDLTPLPEAVDTVVCHNRQLLPADHDLGIIVFVTAGQNPTYLGAQQLELARRPTVCVHTFPLPFEFWMDKYESGQSLVISPIQALPAKTLAPQVKFRSRAHWYLADRLANETSPGSSALLVDVDNQLTETSAGNLFVVQDGTLWTPPDGIVLGGISRQVTFELAARLGIECQQHALRPEHLEHIDEAFTTSTTYCLLPVSRIDGRPVGEACPGPITGRLLSGWNELVGRDIIAQARAAGTARLASFSSAHSPSSAHPSSP